MNCIIFELVASKTNEAGVGICFSIGRNFGCTEGVAEGCLDR